MKDFDKNKESSYLKHWDVNNLYGWTMSQKLPVDSFEWVEDTWRSWRFHGKLQWKSYEGNFLKIYVMYPEKLHEIHNDLSFLTERMEFEKIKKFVANLHDKTKYPIYIRNLKQALNHELVLKKAHRVIKLDQKATKEKIED